MSDIVKRLEEDVDYGGYDGFGPDALHIGAAKEIKKLRVTVIELRESCKDLMSAHRITMKKNPPDLVQQWERDLDTIRNAVKRAEAAIELTKDIR